MIRSLLCCAALVGATSALRAGELDGDKPAPKAITPVVVAPTLATELDGESPTAAHRRGGWGYGGYGGGYGVSVSFGSGYGGYGGYYGGYRGYSNYYGGYSSYYSPSYYYQPSYVSYSSYGYYPSYYGGNCW